MFDNVAIKHSRARVVKAIYSILQKGLCHIVCVLLLFTKRFFNTRRFSLCNVIKTFFFKFFLCALPSVHSLKYLKIELGHIFFRYSQVRKIKSKNKLHKIRTHSVKKLSQMGLFLLMYIHRYNA